MDAPISRRRLLQTGGTVALAAGTASIVIVGRVRAQQKTLKILKWVYPIVTYDEWFIDAYVKEWGEQNNMQVLVDRVGLGEVNSGAMAEADKRQGHDLVMLLIPEATYEDEVIDHREIYEGMRAPLRQCDRFRCPKHLQPQDEETFWSSLGLPGGGDRLREKLVGCGASSAG
jgi:hypothetical protein